MRENLMAAAWRDLQDQQTLNERTERRRKAEIRQGYPAIAELMDQRERLIGDTMRGILAGEKSPEDLTARMEEISGQIRAALRGAGFPEDYLSPVYACPHCRDTGYVGDTIREPCACVRRRYQERLRQAIGMTDSGEETFETFDPLMFSPVKTGDAPSSPREFMGIVREICQRWADHYPNQTPRDLTLSGKTGVGKTFLLHAMAARLRERGFQPMVISAYSFQSIARKSYFQGDEGLEELIQTEILMLDDLGSEPMIQNITTELLFTLINERQRRRRATVVSTNLSGEELKNRYSERIASRLSDQRNAMFITIQGKDLRTNRE